MKKSKFLKKSLAMLLALMLVVAMIPLSASAASIDLTHIYLDDGPVKLGDTVGVKDTSADLRLGAALPDGYELRVKSQVSTVDELTLTTNNQNVPFAQYRTSDNKIELTLYKNARTELEAVDATYSITVNTVAKNTTTNLDPNGFSFTNTTGVYSATVDNINGIVNVVLARNTQANSIALDGSFQATMKVSTLADATIDAANNGKKVAVKVNANDGDSFEVYSEDGNSHRTFKVKATYLDALNSFTVTGLDGKEYTGTPVDTTKDNIPDTIVVTMPASAIYNSYNELTVDPSLEVSFEAEGHVNTVEIGHVDAGNNKTNYDDYKSGSKVQFLGLDDGTSTLNYVLVTRLDDARGAKQFYKLTVQLEKSSSTTVVGAIVNKTIAEVDNEARTIVANLPNAEITDTTKETVTLWLAKGATAKIDDQPLAADGSGVTEEGVPYDIYKIGSQDLSKGKIVTVTAQDGTSVQYTLTVAATTNVTDATITAFWLKDPTTGKTYPAEVTGKEDDLVVTVPYMTTKITDWVVYVTPASYTYVTDRTGLQVYSGGFTAQKIGFDNIYVPTSGDYSTTLIAVNKNDTTVKETYTIHVKLDTTNITTGHQLSEVWFTAQPNTNNTDKLIYRGIRNTTDSSCNLFDQEVEQETAGNHNVVTLNIEVPRSLTNPNDLGITYQNSVTDFSLLNDQGVAFIKDTGFNGYSLLSSITSSEDKFTGSKLEDDTQIVVLPEEVARWALTNASNNKGSMGQWNGYYGILDFGKELKNVTYADGKSVADMGTVYTVNMTPAKGQSGSVLKSMSIGNTALSIEDYVISGKLNFSQTVSADEAKTLAKAYYATFELSDYAKLTDNTVNYYSNGDIDGNGTVDDPDSDGSDTVNIANGNYKDENNYKFLFVRKNDAKHSVTVYRIYADGAAGEIPNGKVYVKAEDRLDNPAKASISTYTFDLTWAAPNEEAEITSFSIGNFTGKIVNSTTEERTITVEVPYGTDVTGLVAKFTASPGATLEMGSPESGIAFESGVTSVNYTNPVKVRVTSEDRDTTHMYTITVKVGLSFSDVPENAWYHDNVMDAANNGYVSGMGDGTFNPTGATTRAQFAAMIANAMGYDDNPDVESAFPDVADNYWGKAAINFCYENEIITGYDDGTFQPEKVITRQEAAAILNNAFELAEKYGISTEKFPDNGVIADWAADHVYAAKAAGLMKGDADTGNFRPTSTITRAEAASIMMNAKNAGLIK